MERLFEKKIEFGIMYLTQMLSVFAVFLICIQSKCGKIRTRKTSNTDTLHAVVNRGEGKHELML